MRFGRHPAGAGRWGRRLTGGGQRTPRGGLEQRRLRVHSSRFHEAAVEKREGL